MFMLLGLIIPLMLIINFMVSNASRELLVSLLGENGADMLRFYLVTISSDFMTEAQDFICFSSCYY